MQLPMTSDEEDLFCGRRRQWARVTALAVARGGLSAAAAAGENWAKAPCATITTAVLLPGCMQVAVSMEKPPGTCFAGGGANGLALAST